MTTTAEALGGVLVGQIEGDPGGVREVAESWRSGARTVEEAVGLSGAARGAVPSWQGEAAAAFSTAAGSLESGLEAGVGCLSQGASALDDYAGVLESAIHAAAALREQAGRVLLEAVGNPSKAGAAVGAMSAIAGAWASLRAEVDLAAARAAAVLGGPGGGASGANTGSPEKDKPGDNGWWSWLIGRETEETKGRTAYTDEEMGRLKEQASGARGWGDPHQGGIGDCYLLASLQAYSETPEGQQFLSDHVWWDGTAADGQGAFVVKLYDGDKEVKVEVRTQYDSGLQGESSLLDIYERAYGTHVGNRDLDNGGHGEETMEHISGQDAYHIDTHGGSGFAGWPWWDDHEYTGAEWNEIEQAVKDGKPVVAETTGGAFSGKGGAVVSSTVDTNGNGRIDGADRQGNYRLVGGDYFGKGENDGHAYTVVDIDDDYVTLKNPWGHNDAEIKANNQNNNGLIRITREDYEKYFNRTDIGSPY